jgi:hypothetical protein
VIYLRATDGSPAVKLGEGVGQAISPDGKWVTAYDPPAAGKAGRLSLLPTGPGEAHPLGGDGFVDYGSSAWLPDSAGVVFSARKEDGVSRIYVQAVSGGKPRPIGPERVRLSQLGSPVSPDGRFVVGLIPGQVLLIPLDGGPTRPIPGLTSRENRVSQWSADSRALYVYRLPERPLRVMLLDVASGEQRFWKEIPFEESVSSFDFRVSPDGNTWAYAGRQVLSELYLVGGLR